MVSCMSGTCLPRSRAQGSRYRATRHGCTRAAGWERQVSFPQLPQTAIPTYGDRQPANSLARFEDTRALFVLAPSPIVLGFLPHAVTTRRSGSGISNEGPAFLW